MRLSTKISGTGDVCRHASTSRKKFLATERKFMTDPIGYMQANSNIRITVRNEDGTPREGADLLREYNPLETE